MQVCIYVCTMYMCVCRWWLAGACLCRECVYVSVFVCAMYRFQERRTTVAEVVQGLDLSGKVVVITGGNTGLGFEAALTIVGAGAHVVLACRDAVKAEAAVQRILSKHVGILAYMWSYSILWQQWTTGVLMWERIDCGLRCLAPVVLGRCWGKPSCTPNSNPTLAITF